MKRNFYRFTVVILAIIMTVVFMPSPTFAANEEPQEDEYVGGYIPPGIELYHVPNKKFMSVEGLDGWAPYDVGEMPGTYDPREAEWFQDIKVKAQKSTGLCWAFATTTAAEISYAKEYYGTPEYGKFAETSPAHLGYFARNKVTDPLGGTAGDQGNCATWYNGGSYIESMLHLATWSGLGAEADTPFAEKDFNYDTSFAYKDVMTIEDAIYYSSNTYRDEAGCIDRDYLKYLIQEYGAAVASVDYKARYFKGGQTGTDCGYYNNLDSEVNHAVTIVGWDDDYSRENFGSYTSEGDNIGYTVKPENDGAWLVQNSHGAGKHNGGYFYVSYESMDILSDEILVLDMQPADPKAYNYQYDGGTYHTRTGTSQKYPQTDKNDKAANIFKAQSKIVLDGTGFTEYNAGWTEYDIDVYKGLKDPGDPESGAHVGCYAYDTETAGYKTCEFDEDNPIIINKGELFSIVITFRGTTSMGVEALLEGNASSNVQTTPGQSFYRDSSGSWVDMADAHNACFRIKALAHQVEQPDITLSTKSYIYNKSKVRTPAVTVKVGGKTLKKGTDYKVFYPSGRKYVGTYKVRVVLKGDYRGTGTASFKITKATNPLTVKGKTYTIKRSKVKKATQKFAATKVLTFKSKGKGTLTYTKSSGNKKITIAKKTGKVTVKKGLKKGKYKVKVKVRAAGTANYKSRTRTVTFTVRVK